MVTAMFDNFLAPEGGHPTREGNFIEKYIKLQGPSFWERSGRVVESRPIGLGSSLTGVTVVWSLSKTHLSWLSTSSTQEDPSLFN